MPLRHHPSAQVRADYATANLSPGAALVVGVHLQFCSVCTIAVQALNGFPPQPAPDVFDMAGAGDADARLPPSLQNIPRGPWRSLGPRIFGAPLQGVSGLGEAAWLVEAADGAPLSLSRREGVWGAVVLSGEAQSGEAIFGPGDFVDSAEAPLVRPAIPDKLLLLVATMVRKRRCI